MKKFTKILLIGAVLFTATAVFAGPPRKHKHKKNDGLELANGIVDLVLRVIDPTPTVYVAPQYYQRPAPPPRHYRRPAPPPRRRPARPPKREPRRRR